MKPQIHLALVSDQAVPNITPLLDPRFQPEQLVLLVSPDKRHKARWLTEVLRPRGIATREWPIEDAWNIEQVRERVWQLLDTLNGKSIALNATGGTKPMSIAAYEAFRDWKLPIFYVHPEQDRVIWMHPSDEPSFQLADRIRLEAFLQAHGASVEGRIERSPVDPARVELTRDLVKDLSRFSRALRTLNWFASTAQNAGLRSSEEMSDLQMDSMALRDLLDRFEETGLLRLEDRTLRFPTEEARFFVNGGWLEEYVFTTLQNLKADLPRVQDIGRSIDVLRETGDGQVPNELDVALLADNRFYLIECKTRQWSSRGRPHEDSFGAEALYKLDTIKDLLGGLQARAMLISYQDVPRHDRTRAEDLGIRVCGGNQIQQLGRMLSDWIG